jgi:hypothetical protein
VGNSPGNNRGINWELAGFSRQTRNEWLDEFGLAMFNQMVPIVRADAAKYGIPLVRRTVAELKAFKPGVTCHNDLRVAFGGTTHTDPGEAFPWDVFLETMKGTDMDANQAAQLTDTVSILTAMAAGADTAVVHDKDGTLDLRPFYQRIAQEVGVLNPGSAHNHPFSVSVSGSGSGSTGPAVPA